MVTIDDDIYEAALCQARATGQRLGRVLSEMVRQALQPDSHRMSAARRGRRFAAFDVPPDAPDRRRRGRRGGHTLTGGWWSSGSVICLVLAGATCQRGAGGLPGTGSPAGTSLPNGRRRIGSPSGGNCDRSTWLTACSPLPAGRMR